MQALKYHHQYHQSLNYKITCGTKPDNVVYNFEDALQIIKNNHDVTRGMKQIAYLVGWQYDGHDSKYPAFFEFNPRLKRAQDSDARDGYLWLVEEAKQYNAVVSVHINLCDAYDNSPLWDDYVRKDLLVREADGSLQKGGIWDGEQSYRVSKTREWAAGETQKRIERFLDLLPIAEAHTVHIDAFFPKPSPYHGVTMEDEIKTIQEIIRYWHSLGVDVTGELFIHEYAGLLPMAWNFNGDEATRLKYPASVLCGGGPGWNARHCKDAEQVAWVGVFTAPEAGCLYDEAWGHSGVGHAGLGRDTDQFDNQQFTETFFLNTVVWALMNQRSIIQHVHTPESYEVHFSGDLLSKVRTADRYHTVTDAGRLIVDGTDTFVPVTWQEKECIAFSKNGCEKTWQLPPEWAGVSKVAVTPLYPIGSGSITETAVVDGKLTLNLAAGQAVGVTPPI